ncbi:hypothetical protein [Silvanigrella aquatica]|uniref:Uncharacterized protein n=1 Tax=Silvanigrella aquatica TaxID=1915309 RepID=A0A1L4CY94_9BACT|nr:hypothetical protein [Silvanigrella aquatica]APJ02931.1 hypothetical protein AXG55_02965 [Silvanigrella aquatica]
MSKQFKIIVLSLLGVLTLIASICIVFLENKNSFLQPPRLSEVGTASASQEAKTFPIPEIVSSPLKYNAWYVVKLGNIPIGEVVVGVDDLNTGFPSNYAGQFVSRIGSSPLLSILKGDLTYEDSGSYKLQQSLLSQTENGSFKEIQNIWKQEKDSGFLLNKDAGASLQGVIPANMTHAKSKLRFDEFSSVFYFNPKDKRAKTNKIFVPFIGAFLNVQDVDPKYDDDGFLNTGKLTFDGGSELNFMRIEKDRFVDLSKTISDTLIDYGWFSSLNSIKTEFDTLKKSLDSCSSRTASLNSRMIKYLPQSSYLSYRRIINMSHFCVSLNRQLNNKDQESSSQKLMLVSNAVKSLLKENSQELPYFLAYSPDTILFYNDTISFLWPRIASLLAQTAINELENNFELDRSRKSLVGIQLNIANLQPRAVVRAQIQLIDSPINFIIEPFKGSNMNSSSLVEIPNDIQSPLKVYYINGQSFAKKMDIDFNSFCKANKGKIGVDLGDAPQIAINSESVRGVWDLQTRIEVARQFAIKSTIAKGCTDIYFRVPLSMDKAFAKELDLFKSEVLGSENELLLSNNVQKKLWIIPGKYRIVVTSLVTGSVMSAQEFSVTSGVNTNVTAKIN